MKLSRSTANEEVLPDKINMMVMNAARMDDCFLGGKNSRAADREAATKVLEAAPDVAGPLVGAAVGSPVVDAALRMRAELEGQGITAQVREGYGLALVQVHPDLVVWSEIGPEGLWFRWWSGRLSDRTGRYVYSVCPASAVELAARAVAARFRDLRVAGPLARGRTPSAAGGRVRPYPPGTGRR